jgi:hypothetical protein
MRRNRWHVVGTRLVNRFILTHMCSGLGIVIETAILAVRITGPTMWKELREPEGGHGNVFIESVAW